MGPLIAPVSEGVEIGRLKVWRGTALALDLPVKTLAAVREGGLTRRAFDAGLELAQSWLRRPLPKKGTTARRRGAGSSLWRAEREPANRSRRANWRAD
jgi:hypothetical protein